MAATINKNKRIGIWLAVLVVAMFGFGYLMVPLYDVLCSALNINGKTGGATSASVAPVDLSRTITVQFLANNTRNLPWEFHPGVTTIKLHPGENKRVYYFAKNDSDHEMTVQAIPSVTPTPAAQYLKKTECFCFNQQTLKSGESMEMPLLFHLDRDIPKDMHVVTLSYALFDVTSKKYKKPNSKVAGKIN